MLNDSTADRLSLLICFVKLMKSPHITLSLFELQKHHSHDKRELIFLGHGNALPWNFTSGTVPRVKHPEPANSQTGCGGRPEQARPFLPCSPCDPLWHSRVCILDILPQYTSYIHAAQQASAPASRASAVHSGWQTCLQHHYAPHNTAGFDGSSTVTCGTGL